MQPIDARRYLDCERIPQGLQAPNISHDKKTIPCPDDEGKGSVGAQSPLNDSFIFSLATRSHSSLMPPTSRQGFTDRAQRHLSFASKPILTRLSQLSRRFAFICRLMKLVSILTLFVRLFSLLLQE